MRSTSRYTLIVRRCGETVQPVVGERVLAVFGLPAAQEDHAQRAMLAALELQHRLQQELSASGAAPTRGRSCA